MDKGARLEKELNARKTGSRKESRTISNSTSAPYLSLVDKVKLC